jgi:hypothetical protein
VRLFFILEEGGLITDGCSDPRDYLKHIMASTNMACLTPEGAMSGDCDFLSANLYARSLFGEDALANLSIERTEGGTITGHVRIRSKTQGIALSLGDRITMGESSCYFKSAWRPLMQAFCSTKGHQGSIGLGWTSAWWTCTHFPSQLCNNYCVKFSASKL